MTEEWRRGSITKTQTDDRGIDNKKMETRTNYRRKESRTDDKITEAKDENR
jgi:hypothetical protein